MQLNKRLTVCKSLILQLLWWWNPNAFIRHWLGRGFSFSIVNQKHMLPFNLCELVQDWPRCYYCHILGNGISGISELHPPGPGCPKCAGGERKNSEDRRFRPHQEHQGKRGLLHCQRRKRQPCVLVSKEEGRRWGLEKLCKCSWTGNISEDCIRVWKRSLVSDTTIINSPAPQTGWVVAANHVTRNPQIEF